MPTYIIIAPTDTGADWSGSSVGNGPMVNKGMAVGRALAPGAIEAAIPDPMITTPGKSGEDLMQQCSIFL